MPIGLLYTVHTAYSTCNEVQSLPLLNINIIIITIIIDIISIQFFHRVPCDVRWYIFIVLTCQQNKQAVLEKQELLMLHSQCQVSCLQIEIISTRFPSRMSTVHATESDILCVYI